MAYYYIWRLENNKNHKKYSRDGLVVNGELGDVLIYHCFNNNGMYLYVDVIITV